MNTINRHRAGPGPHHAWLKWSIAAVLLIVADTLTTMLAVETGHGVETNPLLAGLVHNQHYLALAILKTTVIGLVIAVWHIADDGRFNHVVVNYALAAGTLVVLSNTVMILAGVITA